MRIFTLIRDLFDAPVSRTGAWRILNQTYRQMACRGQETQRQSEASAGRKIPASPAAEAAPGRGTFRRCVDIAFLLAGLAGVLKAGRHVGRSDRPSARGVSGITVARAAVTRAYSEPPPEGP